MSEKEYILHVKAVKALDLPKMDLMGKCDPYLVFQIYPKPEKYQTKYIDQTYEPVWNEEFHIPIGKIKPNDFLHVELYDYDRVGADELISTYDFYLDSLYPEKVIDSTYEFYPARKVPKGGIVHLIFHLTTVEAVPFKERDVDPSLDFMLHVPVMSREGIRQVRTEFIQNDKARDGCMDEEELDAYFSDYYPELRCITKLILHFFGTNGRVDIDQFIRFYSLFSNDRSNDVNLCRDLFDKIDENHNGTIEASEIEKVASMIRFKDDEHKEDVLKKIVNADYEKFNEIFYELLEIA